MKKIIVLLIVLTNISVIGFAQRLRATRSVVRPCAHARTNNAINNAPAPAPQIMDRQITDSPDPSPMAKEAKKPEEGKLQSFETEIPKPGSESPKAVTDKPKQNQAKPQESGKPL